MTATNLNPAWHDGVTVAQRAVAKAVGIDWQTLPRAFFFGPEPAPVILAPAVAPPSDLTDLEWRLLRPFFPSHDRKNAAPIRRYLDGALYQKAARCRFSNIPKRYGSTTGALRKRLEDWAARGTFATLLEALEAGDLDALDPSRRAYLLSLAREWAARGVKYAVARERRA